MVTVLHILISINILQSNVMESVYLLLYSPYPSPSFPLTSLPLILSSPSPPLGATGQALKEAQNINKSLSALGDVIAARAAKQVRH